MRVQRQQIVSVDDERRLAPAALRPTIRLVSPPEAALDPALQSLIGERLRSYYADLLAEPVPPRFVELVSRLDRKH